MIVLDQFVHANIAEAFSVDDESEKLTEFNRTLSCANDIKINVDRLLWDNFLF
jgi:hypothetical protein